MNIRRALIGLLVAGSLLASLTTDAVPADISQGIWRAGHPYQAPTEAIPALEVPWSLRAESKGSLDIECGDLVPDELIEKAIGAHDTPWQLFSFPAYAYSLRDAALAQDGGFSCTWPNVPGPEDIYSWGLLTISALPDAAEIYARNRQASLGETAAFVSYEEYDLFDGALIRCDGQSQFSCTWQVLAGDVWLVFQFDNLSGDNVVVDTNESTSINRVTPVLMGSDAYRLVASAIATIHDAAREPLKRADSGLPTCEQIGIGVSSALRRKVISQESLPPALDSVASDHYWSEMSSFSFERLGYRSCSLDIIDSAGVSFYLTRSLDWLIEPPRQTPHGLRSEIDGIGTLYDGCQPEDWAYESCDYLVVSDDVMVGFPFQMSSTNLQVTMKAIVDALDN